jgi:hypothetical protein
LVTAASVGRLAADEGRAVSGGEVLFSDGLLPALQTLGNSLSAVAAVAVTATALGSGAALATKVGSATPGVLSCCEESFEWVGCC